MRRENNIRATIDIQHVLNRNDVVKERYCFLPRDHVANPIVPSASPATEAPHEKKFKKNVDCRTWITIKKGKITPKSSKITPRLRRKPGEFIKSG